MPAKEPQNAGGKPAEANDNKSARDVQPGTAQKGKSWQSRRPLPEDEDDKLNEALKDSFPASDPPEPVQPGVTGWDLDEKETARRKEEALRRK
jgi:hypothetical protein